MEKDLYTDDFASWAEKQAAILRGMQGFRGLDAERLAEEVEDLGRSDVLKVKSLLRQALSHLIKIASKPDADPLDHWKREVNTFIFDAQDQYSPSYRQRIDLDAIWKKSKKMAEDDLATYGESVASLPDACPLTIDWLMDDEAYDLTAACTIVTNAVDTPSPH